MENNIYNNSNQKECLCTVYLKNVQFKFESNLSLVVIVVKRRPVLGKTMNGMHPVEMYFPYSALFMYMILSDLLESFQDVLVAVERSSI